MSDFRNDMYYIGIGSSAGGLSALKDFFSNVPGGINACFIVAQHLSPNYKSNLTEILTRVDMPLSVSVLEGPVRPEAGKIYVTPPNHDVIIRNKMLVLVSSDGIGPKPSVDRLLHSMGENLGSHAIAVIFSGTGSDGSRGILKVHEMGGLVIVQNPEEAEHDGMPMASIRTEAVDFTMHAAEIGNKIYEITKNQPPSISSLDEGEAKVQQLLKKVFRNIHRDFGVNLSDYKETTITRRLQRRMVATGKLELEEYLKYSLEHPDEQSEFYHDMIISVTEYFRDTEAFKAIDKNIRKLVNEKEDNASFRVWVPGCATGEEAYSLACLFGEILGGLDALTDKRVQIFATDIDDKALNVGRRGVYEAKNLYAISSHMLEKYFVGQGRTFRVRKELRDCILFNRHNIIENPPFKRLDMVSCRNLLIYLQPDIQAKLINLFHYALNDDGLLFLGKSENLSRHEDLFTSLDSTNRIFRKRAGYNTSPSSFNSPVSLQNKYTGNMHSISRPEKKNLERMFDDLIESIAPNSILVNDRFMVKKIMGTAHEFVSIQKGNFTSNLIDLLLPDLKSIVQVLLMKAQRNNKPVKNKILRKMDGDQVFALKMEVKPIREIKAMGKMMLISFEKEKVELDTENIVGAGDGEEVQQLNEEVSSLREHLRSVVEELESSNEELQLSNEEMQSSNEELQSTNEELETANQELQSTNEELSTVNDELNSKTQELEKQTAELEQLVNSLHYPVMRINQEYQVKRFNLAAQETFNIRKNTPETLPLFAILPHELNFDDMRKKMQQAMLERKSHEEEVSFNGRYYEMELQPIIQKNNKEEKEILLLFKDRTELIKERRMVKDSERRLKAILDNTTTPIYIKDLAGRYILVNEAFLELFNLSEEKVLGSKDKDLFPKEMADKVAQNDLQTLQKEEVLQLEEEILDKEGHRVTYLSVKFPMQNQEGEIIALCGISTDITEKVEFEDYLRMYQRIITSMNDMVVVAERPAKSKDPMQIVYANPELLEQTGYAEDEIKKLNLKDILPLIDFSNKVEYGTSSPQEMPLVDRDGKELLIERQVVNVNNKLSQKQSIAVIIRDISVRKKHENRLMEEKVAAEAASVAKSAFLANMSHEIRTPMSAIHGITNILTKMEVEEDRKKKLLDTLKTSSDRLLSLINDILDYAKMEAGQLNLEITTFDLYKELNQQVEMASAAGQNKSLEFILNIDPNLPRTYLGDPMRISQVLQNLLSNAIKFTERGKITLSATSEGNSEDNHLVKITVADTGIGISKDQKNLIFEKFSQADVSTSRKFGGTGLGLAIVKELLELMNGTIELDSSLGNGSTFTVIIPLGKTEETEVENSLESHVITEDLSPIFTDPKEAAEYPILVVEDQLTNVTVMEHYLKNLGCRYDIAMNGKSGLQKVLRKNFSLLLLDIQMNEMDGLELSQIIRMLPDEKKRSVPIVGVTAHVHSEYQQLSRKAGMNGYLSKPVEPSLLKQQIMKQLGLSAEKQSEPGE
ncbi:CheR family methyltransferase [Roseivirga sp. BDSF3-8]|uniref:CheR family methyltransferase n=1 Tax=Roseivirga sp. BDSF3-8 TaxID=3241598 RepID=UPI003531C1FA